MGVKMPILRSKIAVVICGALLIGAVSGTLAAFSAAQHSTAAPGPALAQGSATATSTSATSTSATKSASGGPTAVPTSTSTPLIPTPTPAIGQPLDLHGEVASVDKTAGTFVLQLIGGGTMTCKVSSSTQWPGTAKDISTLLQGMQAEVQGTYQGSGALAASQVDAQPDH